jgi:coenzyme F420-0:L-glutamate ligase/coenzyme F420-1:gamma-L-glutamate ligase
VNRLEVLAPDGVGEIGEGDDLAALLAGLVELDDGDVVLVTSKAVAKAEGRVVPGTRDDLLPDETARVVARRGPTTIVRTHHGLTLAAAGIDASNVAPGHVVLLPVDPDVSARRLRTRLGALTGRTVAVVVTDTAGRAWRHGQTDLAVGAAGLRVLDDHAGRHDPHGNELVVTAPAVADELAGAAELVQGKLGRRPFAVVRGRSDLVLPGDDDGAGAAALVRGDHEDMFGLGSREAVVRALAADPDDAAGPAGFGAPAGAADVAYAVATVTGRVPTPLPDGGLASDGDVALLRPLARAHGWRAVAEADGLVRMLPPTP